MRVYSRPNYVKEGVVNIDTLYKLNAAVSCFLVLSLVF